MQIQVKVKLKSKHESITIDEEGIYHLRINALPIEGRANKKIIEILSKHFGVPKKNVILKRGAKGQRKTFIIQSL